MGGPETTLARVVLFDLDGTLADTAPDLGYALNSMRLARGLGDLPISHLRTLASSGARGLLQIMPETAFFITQRHPALHNPAVNLAVGQQYIAWLAALDGVSGDLIRLLASYNAGPAALARASAGIHDGGDPLLFIEAMPIPETRAFIERVLTYTWLYAARLRLPAPSLDELAAGDWPRYHLLGPMQRPSSGPH